MPLNNFLGSTVFQKLRSRQVNELENKPPRNYLELAEAHAREVRKLISPDCSPSPKFYQLQCECLGDKLTQVLKYLGSCSSCDAHSKPREHIFKGLFVVSKEVRTFVVDCCKDQWIQAALMMGDQVEYVCLLYSQLDFYEEVFVKGCLIGGIGMTRNRSEEFDRRRICDIGNIRHNASRDREKLLSVLATLHPGECSGDQYTLGSNLQKRLQCRYSGGDAGELRFIKDICAWEIEYKGLKRQRQLGKGASASVYETTWMGESLAEKRFENDEQFFKNELSILIGLSHPNILSLYCFASDSDSHDCSLFVKLMDDDLYNFIHQKMREDKTLTAPFDILEAVGIMLQIAEGMHYLHTNKIVHRDLKSRNVLVKLVKAGGEFDVDYVHARVADFGLSTIKEMSRTFSAQTLNTGTTRWMAPELYTASQDDPMNTSTSDVKLRYPFKIDIYSFGMLCYEILSGRMPFYDIKTSELRKRVLGGLRPKLPEECPSLLATMIKRCWEPNPSARPRFSDICKDLRYQKALLIIGQQDVEFCTDDLELAALTSEGASGWWMVPKQEATTDSSVVHQGLITSTSAKVYPDMPVCTVAPGLFQRAEPGPSQFSRIPRNLEHDNVVVCCLANVSEWLKLKSEVPPKGSLHDLLHGRQGAGDSQIRPVLQWQERVRIALGAARGLKYLHESVQPPVCHGNITSSSVWVFDDFTAKVQYPGHMPYGAGNVAVKEVHTILQGDEYEWGGALTQKGDVFSFGLVLLELLSGRKACDFTLPQGEPSIGSWATPWLDGKDIFQSIDPRLERAEYDPQAAYMALVAGNCLQHDVDCRPTMRTVVCLLELSLT